LDVQNFHPLHFELPINPLTQKNNKVTIWGLFFLCKSYFEKLFLDIYGNVLVIILYADMCMKSEALRPVLNKDCQTSDDCKALPACSVCCQCVNKFCTICVMPCASRLSPPASLSLSQKKNLSLLSSFSPSIHHLF